MSIINLYQDFGINYHTEGHKHCRPGWVNIECPFCSGNPGLHLGCHINSGHFYCWRCGWKPASRVIAKLLGVGKGEAKKIAQKYKITRSSSTSISQAHKIRIKPYKLPSYTKPLEKQHIQYLESRRFDPDYLEKEYNLLGTGPSSFLDGINYRHRIVAPIYWQNEQVSFQTRDITDKSNLKYMACPKAREKFLHQNILYGTEKTWKSDIGICVEGITDVWRLGEPAFAIFGIEYSYKQVRIIAKLFKYIIILFDDDPQASKQGKQLQQDLEFRGVLCHQEIIKGDPASMSQEEANHFKKQIIGGRK